VSPEGGRTAGKWARRLAVSAGPLLGLALFVAALVVLRHELQHYTYREVMAALRVVPATRLLLALALTALSYLILTGYDVLAVRYVGRHLRYRRIALASFLGYAFSNSVGFSVLSGGPVRYRVYSSSRFSPLDVAKIMAFCAVTLWLGFFAIAATVFLAFPFAPPSSLHLPFASSRPLGLLCLAPVLAYLLLTLKRGRSLAIRGWVVPVPSPRLAVAQLVLSGFDWAVAGAVLYALLPPGPRPSFAAFLGVFLLAQVAGVISQVPGGLGVFETFMVVLMPAEVPRAALLASLVAYRSLYYLLPLVAAALTLGVREAMQRRGRSARVSRGSPPTSWRSPPSWEEPSSCSRAPPRP
jgi:uncharacterized membrane protein YbhN (UPF0104 family)